MLKKFISIVVMVLCMSSTAYSQNQPAATTAQSKTAPAPILIQGALPIETSYMVSQLEHVVEEKFGGWSFWKGDYQGYPMIISKTRMGMSNAAAATAIAIEKYRPIAIINQGTAGGHDPQLHSYDIVLGKHSINIGAFRTPKRALGEGADALTWTQAFDVLPDDEADPEPIAIRRFAADSKLLQLAAQQKPYYTQGQVVEGIIGSADVWNNELDRIAFFRQYYQTSAEEMEAASVAQIALQYNTPFLAIRILSNNITNNSAYQAGTGEACQKFALVVAKAYMQDQYPH